jgi:hypothetical protein
MSKLGRYSADRKKVATITATKTIEVSDCGTIFVLNPGSATTLTLPKISDAGPGWWCRFVFYQKNSNSNDITMNAASGDALVVVNAPASGSTRAKCSGSLGAVAGGSLKFDVSEGAQGDTLELYTDGSLSWFGTATLSGSGFLIDAG